MTVQQILVKHLGALPAIREYLERLQLKERVDAVAPVRDVARLTNGEVVVALVAHRLPAPGRCLTSSSGPRTGRSRRRSGSRRRPCMMIGWGAAWRTSRRSMTGCEAT